MKLLKGMLIIFTRPKTTSSVNQNTQHTQILIKYKRWDKLILNILIALNTFFQIKASQEKNLDMKQLKQALLQIGDS
ncbi:hypothetical protein ACEW7V_00695 [Areca yellow leaf disease phytoplasma]|uniref:hypothetical protein n=1 Tax=Areca yellow leaf disease phytoplasma TaxID=927614 RepID=UPI0035B50792